VNALAAARLVTVSQEGEEEETVELVGEALLRNWPRLRQWLDEDRDFLLWRQNLRSAATDWERNQHDPDLLLRRARLNETERRMAERRLDLSDTEHVFLRESAARRQRRTVRWVLGAAVTSFALAIIVLFYINQSQQQTKAALSSKLAARASTVLDGQRDLALLLSLESLRLNDTVEARGTLLRTLQLVPSPSIRTFLRDSKSAVGSIAFSRDGELLAPGNKEGILLWDVASGKLLMRSSIKREIDSIAFSPDGTTLASGGEDGVALWTADGSSASSLPQIHRKEVDSVAFSPDGKILASGSDDHTIILWDSAKETQIRTLRGHTGEVDSVAFSPNGEMLASGSEDGTIILWDPKTGMEVDRLLGDRSGIDSVAFSPDGKLLAAGTDARALFLWSVVTRKQIGSSLQGHTADINSVAFSPDSSMLASGSYDGAILLWDVAARQQLWQIKSHDGPVQSLAFSPDGKTLASSGEDKNVILWDVVAFAPSLGRPLPLTGASIAAFRPDGKLLTVGTDNTIALRDTATGKVLDRLADLPVGIRHVAVSPDGKLLAASSGTQILLWDAASRRLLDHPFVGHQAAVFGVAFSPDGKLLASASEDHNVRLWDVASRQSTGSLAHTTEVLSVAFSPGGKTLASGDFTGSIYLWDVASRQQLNVLPGQQSPVFGLSFRPDGEMLASSDGRSNIFLWDTKAAQPFGELLTNQRGAAYGVSFSPDGKTLASSGDPVTLWDVDFNSWRARACSLANRNLTRAEWKAEIGDLLYQKTCPNLPEPSSKPPTPRNSIS
jgi:WD40 repeat protein